MKRSQADIIISIFIFVILSTFTLQIFSVPAEARSYPLVLLVTSYLINAFQLIKFIKQSKLEEAPEKSENFKEVLKTIIIYSIIMALYIFLIDKISYIASTLLFIFVSLKYLKVRSWKLLIALPICMTFLVYFAFTRFLMVPLPEGTWFYITL